MSDQTAQQAKQVSSGEFPLQRDHAEEARQWEAFKQAFRDAGMPLAPEQTRNVLEPKFQANPVRTLVELILPFYLPEWIARSIFRSSAVANSVLVSVEATRTILTPEQQQVWERYLSDRGKGQRFASP